MARLPAAYDRIEERGVDLRDGIPLSLSHPIREIDEYMDEIVANAIDVIQERCNDNELRTFYYNLMAKNDYKNRDFEDMIGIAADLVDIGVGNQKFRDVRDAVIATVEEVVTLHIGHEAFKYPELTDHMDDRSYRLIQKAADDYEKFIEIVTIYRRNGNELPRRDTRRNGYRDDRFDDRYDSRHSSRRDNRDSGRRVEFGNGPRRDRWNRDGLISSHHGSPRGRRNNENLYGNTDQSDRFDTLPDRTRDSNRTVRDDVRDNPRKPIQRMPGYANTDIVDALEREEQAFSKHRPKEDVKPKEQSKPAIQEWVRMPIRECMDMWVPSAEYPHPYAFNLSQELFLEFNLETGQVRPVLVDREEPLDYWTYDSMAFGKPPKDLSRFENEEIETRVDELHTSLMTPEETFEVEGGEEGEVVTYKNTVELDGPKLMSFSVAESMMRLNMRRFITEGNQIDGDGVHRVDIATANGELLEVLATTQKEHDLLGELRSVPSFTKLREKLKVLSKEINPSTFTRVNDYITEEVNRMMRQYLSIPKLRITSFCDDWPELFSHITQEFGEAYRDAINTYQGTMIKHMFASSVDADIKVAMGVNEKFPNLKPFVMALPVKLIHIEEMSHKLNIDNLPDVASQILPGSHALFHDLISLTVKGNAEIARYLVHTADGKILEISRSFMNEKALLLRVIS